MMGWLITTLSLRQMKGKNLLRCWYKKVRAITWIFLNATLNGLFVCTIFLLKTNYQHFFASELNRNCNISFKMITFTQAKKGRVQL